ncbi:MAG: hypothetical protein M3Q33_11905 [Acidobacteriota bacterium]|nr:hypothetical protein [Acidobacteriota bacterium]
MKNLFYSVFAVVIFSFAAFAQNTQKGVDTQTQKIKEEANKTNTTRSNDVSRSWDFGADKTKVRERIANPYRMNSRRDVLVEMIMTVLKDRKLIVDESASRLKDGIIVTQPYIFAKGAVITRNELSRYAVLPASDTSWTRGRYTLTVEVQSIDGIQNNVSVTSKVEGRSDNGLRSEWTTLSSTGAAEDEFLRKLVEMVTGTSPDSQPDSDQ